MKAFLCAAFIALALPATGFAAAPVLLFAGVDSGNHPSAMWSLPPGVQSEVFEVATSPATASDGYFFMENVVVFDLPNETSTSWTANTVLTPGTYYLHIAGFDEPCYYAGHCPVREFSAIKSFTVSPPPPPPPPPPTPVHPVCVVPHLVGKTLAAAKRALVANDCRTGKVSYGHSRTRRGRVYWQSWRAGARLQRMTKVGLRVSLGR